MGPSRLEPPDHRVRDLLGRYPGVAPSVRLGRGDRREITVRDGAVTAYSMPSAARRRGLPILYVPGWGGTIEGFFEVIRAIGEEVDLYYVETREKRSSTLAPGARFTMDRIACDVADAARDFGLSDGGYLLLGSSYGAAVAVQGLADRVLRPAVTLLYDPMPRLWMPRWVLRYVAPLASAAVVAVLRPALKRIVLAGMRERTQRRRAARFIDAADLRKWRAAAIALRDWDIRTVGPRVDAPVVVVNGCTDRFHDAAIYPQIASAIPASRFLRVPVCESERERLMGAVATTYALDCPNPMSSEDTGRLWATPVPQALRGFVVV